MTTPKTCLTCGDEISPQHRCRCWVLLADALQQRLGLDHDGAAQMAADLWDSEADQQHVWAGAHVSAPSTQIRVTGADTNLPAPRIIRVDVHAVTVEEGDDAVHDASEGSAVREGLLPLALLNPTGNERISTQWYAQDTHGAMREFRVAKPEDSRMPALRRCEGCGFVVSDPHECVTYDGPPCPTCGKPTVYYQVAAPGYGDGRKCPDGHDEPLSPQGILTISDVK